MNTGPDGSVEQHERASLEEILSRYIDALNAGGAPPINTFLAEFTYLTSSARAKLEKVLYFLFASDLSFARTRRHFRAEVHPTTSRPGVEDEESLLPDWLAVQGYLGAPSDRAEEQEDPQRLPAVRLCGSPTIQPPGAGAWPPAVPAGEEGAILEEDAAWQLSYAHWLMTARSLEEGMRFLGEVAGDLRVYGQGSPSPRLRYRVPYLYGLAYLKSGEPLLARAELLAALEFVEKGSEEEIRVRDLLGAAYYLAEWPEKALREHQRCLQAIIHGTVVDQNLFVSINRNIGDDLFALNEIRRAINHYSMALDRLQDVDDFEQHAAVFAALGISYRSFGDHLQALLHFRRAREIYQDHQCSRQAALVAVEIVGSMVARKRFRDARTELAAAESTLAGEGSPLDLCKLYRQWAELALAQRNPAEARRRVRQSLDLADTAVAGPDELPAMGKGHAIGTMAEALHVAALVEESQACAGKADRFFERAFSLLDQTGLLEIHARLARSYADVLSSRGAFAEAVEYYRLAFRCSIRSFPVD